MAVKTTLEQLEEVQAAITEVMTSQELRAGGASGSIRRPELSVLLAERRRLYEQYRTEQGTGGIAMNVGTLRR